MFGLWWQQDRPNSGKQQNSSSKPWLGSLTLYLVCHKIDNLPYAIRSWNTRLFVGYLGYRRLESWNHFGSWIRNFDFNLHCSFQFQISIEEVFQFSKSQEIHIAMDVYFPKIIQNMLIMGFDPSSYGKGAILTQSKCPGVSCGLGVPRVLCQLLSLGRLSIWRRAGPAIPCHCWFIVLLGATLSRLDVLEDRLGELDTQVDLPWSISHDFITTVTTTNTSSCRQV